MVVPPVAVALAKSGLLTKYNLSHVRTMVSGAAALGPDTEEELRSQMQGHAHMRQGE